MKTQPEEVAVPKSPEEVLKASTKNPTITIPFPSDMHAELKRLAEADDRELTKYMGRNIKRLFDEKRFDLQEKNPAQRGGGQE